MGEEETTNISHPTLASECPFMKSPFGAKYFLGIAPILLSSLPPLLLLHPLPLGGYPGYTWLPRSDRLGH